MKRIVWEKWRDSENYDNTLQDLNQDAEISNDEDDDEESVQMSMSVNIYPHIVRTPLGEYSVLDNNLPSKMFDCWIGHTNFPITQEEFEVLDLEIEGIDVLRIVSKYRFFIGVAKLFEFRDVANQINNILCDKAEALDENSLRELFFKSPNIKRWAAMVYPNGDVEYISSSHDEDSEYDALYLDMKSNSNGKFYEGNNN